MLTHVPILVVICFAFPPTRPSSPRWPRRLRGMCWYSSSCCMSVRGLRSSRQRQAQKTPEGNGSGHWDFHLFVNSLFLFFLKVQSSCEWCDECAASCWWRGMTQSSRPTPWPPRAARKFPFKCLVVNIREAKTNDDDIRAERDVGFLFIRLSKDFRKRAWGCLILHRSDCVHDVVVWPNDYFIPIYFLT